MLKKLTLVTVVFFCVSIDYSFAAGTLNEINYKKLQNIHQLIEKNQLNVAKKQLDQFLSKKHSAYTQAIFLQTAAHVSIEQAKYSQAIHHLEQADSLNALPEFVNRNILYNLAQLYLQEENQSNHLRKSMDMLQRWLKNNSKVSAEQNVFAATVYARNNRFKTAISHVKKAINQSKNPKESWYQLLISLYLEQKQYTNAIRIYQQIIKIYPDKKYWKQLSGLYLQINKIHQALAVMVLAKDQGMLSTEEELLRLVSLYLYADIPLAASELLHEGLDSKTIKQSINNWQKLADSWILAQEYSQAIIVLQHISELDRRNGQYPFKIGRLLMEQGKWLLAYRQFKIAQRKQLKNPGENYLLQGISAYYANMPQPAKQAFQKAMKFKLYQEKAKLWLEQVDYFSY